MKSPAPARKPRRCRELLQELFAYLDDELTADRCRLLETHLAACHCCGTLAGNLRKAIALCKVEGAQRLPGAVRANARRRVKALLDQPATAAGTTSRLRTASVTARKPASARRGRPSARKSTR